MAIKRKAATVKAVDEAGTIQAVIATLDVKDLDGDVTRPGAFGTQSMAIVQAHDGQDVMLGKGTLTEKDGKAVFNGKFNLDDPAAKALHSKLVFDLANGDPLIEWSYAFNIRDGGAKHGEFEGDDVQFFQPLDDGTPGIEVVEVSPVLKGAGVGTGTVVAKSRKFTDHIESMTEDLGVLLERVEAVAQLREDDGKELGEEAQRLLGELSDGLTEATARLAGVMDEAKEEGPTGDEVASFAAMESEYMALAQT